MRPTDGDEDGNNVVPAGLVGAAGETLVTFDDIGTFVGS